jgi:hypothetical protein
MLHLIPATPNYGAATQNDPNKVVILTPAIVIQNVLPQQSPTLEERWAEIETWIQESASAELRTVYNSIEIGAVRGISAEELHELRNQTKQA